ncbi:MAG: alpha/beta hydrolase [Candidatus Zapsychrus exili]|nr:alpha/beta hydrolase [Candidatus Zapsychrus exili]
MYFSPKEIGLSFEDLYFITEDNVRLNGWLIKVSESSPTAILFHGNAGNIGDRVEKIGSLNKIGLNVFIVDYRGYGNSGGSSSEAGLYKDAVAAYDYLLTREDINKNKLIGYGVSLGGAVAIDLATRRDLSALIVESSFTNAKDMAKLIMPVAPLFLINIKLDSLLKVKNIPIPKLFIHSREDDVVPFELGKKLYEAAEGSKEFLEIAGGHNEAWMHINEFSASIKKFIEGIK